MVLVENNEKFDNIVVDDQMDEREEYIEEINKFYEDTQDFSDLVEEINNGNR